MNLYLLKRTDEVDYDEYDSCLIRADSEQVARAIANQKCNSPWDSHESFLLASKSTCEIVTAKGNEGVIISSYNAG